MTAEPCVHDTLLEYGSESLAENAVTLHTWANPGCLTMMVVDDCPGHWHIGHATQGEAIACREAREARQALRLADKHRRYVTGPHGPRAESSVQTRPTRSREL